jgi:hypothetical protein
MQTFYSGIGFAKNYFILFAKLCDGYIYYVMHGFVYLFFINILLISL